jgi:hypothetical protein
MTIREAPFVVDAVARFGEEVADFVKVWHKLFSAWTCQPASPAANLAWRQETLTPSTDR